MPKHVSSPNILVENGFPHSWIMNGYANHPTATTLRHYITRFLTQTFSTSCACQLSYHPTWFFSHIFHHFSIFSDDFYVLNPTFFHIFRWFLRLPPPFFSSHPCGPAPPGVPTPSAPWSGQWAASAANCGRPRRRRYPNNRWMVTISMGKSQSI